MIAHKGIRKRTTLFEEKGFAQGKKGEKRVQKRASLLEAFPQEYP